MFLNNLLLLALTYSSATEDNPLTAVGVGGLILLLLLLWWIYGIPYRLAKRKGLDYPWANFWLPFLGLIGGPGLFFGVWVFSLFHSIVDHKEENETEVWKAIIIFWKSED